LDPLWADRSGVLPGLGLPERRVGTSRVANLEAMVTRRMLNHVNVAVTGSSLGEGASLTFGLQCHVQGSRCAVPEVGDAIRALCNNFGLVDSVVRPIAGTLGLHTLVGEGLAVHLAVLEALVVLDVHMVEAERLSRRSRSSFRDLAVAIFLKLNSRVWSVLGCSVAIVVLGRGVCGGPLGVVALALDPLWADRSGVLPGLGLPERRVGTSRVANLEAMVTRRMLNHVNVAVTGSSLGEGASLTFGLQCHVQGSRCAVPEVGDAIRALCNNFGLVDSVVRPIAGTLGLHTLVGEGLAVHLAVLEALVVLDVHVVEAERLSRRSRSSEGG